MKKVLIFAAIAEAATGLALVAVPSLVAESLASLAVAFASSIQRD
jgi:hypothetical protein